jgi:hypothetical protein
VVGVRTGAALGVIDVAGVVAGDEVGEVVSLRTVGLLTKALGVDEPASSPPHEAIVARTNVASNTVKSLKRIALVWDNES